jgi:hypothetical protein
MNAMAIQGLRGIHEPQWMLPWWPLPTYELLIYAAILMLILGLGFIGCRQWHPTFRTYVLAERALRKIEQTYIKDQDAAIAISGLLQLLKRYAMCMHDRQLICAMTAEQWLDYIAEHAGQDALWRQQRSWLLTAPYQCKIQFAMQPYFRATQNWMLLQLPFYFRGWVDVKF